MQNFYCVDADKINRLIADITALQYALGVAEHERDEMRKELEECRRAHSQPICNRSEIIGEYVDVMGEMTIQFTVQLPIELCREQIGFDDPAIEAALQAVSGHVCIYIWGEDKKPAVVYCDIDEQDVEIESDDRMCLEKIQPESNGQKCETNENARD